ncbi:malic enzyme-like NAD(P)-binding protein [Kitasatospora sp. NBC_00315]|uniref:malic enzyme-like NAD(P)-binding protein n=1 Tax=Kitasatospora sp. NBC_00315 TaxID=2975963 RepID=UPI00324729D3
MAAEGGSLADVTREVLGLAAGRRGRARPRTVLVFSDGSSVLSRGALGAEAVRPVLERKCAVLERATGMRAVPLTAVPTGPAEVVRLLELLRPSYDAVLLVDIAAPHCFDIQRFAAETLDCPVLHDDQHGTAVMVAAVVNTVAARTGRTPDGLCTVVAGAGAAGTATARLLHHLGVGELRVVDSRGLLYRGRPGMTAEKAELADLTNPERRQGPLAAALRGADLLLGLSGVPVAADELAGMNPKPIIVPLSYPDVEVRFEDADALGATYLHALEHNLSNNLATPGLLLAACESGLWRLSTSDLAAAVGCLVSLVPDRPDAPPVPQTDPGELARAIADAVVAFRAPSGKART